MYCIYKHIYIYMYTHTRTHIHSHTHILPQWGSGPCLHYCSPQRAWWDSDHFLYPCKKKKVPNGESKSGCWDGKVYDVVKLSHCWVSASQGTDPCIDVSSCIQQHFGQIFMAAQHSHVQRAQAWGEEKRMWRKALNFFTGNTFRAWTAQLLAAQTIYLDIQPEPPPSQLIRNTKSSRILLCVIQLFASCFCFCFLFTCYFDLHVASSKQRRVLFTKEYLCFNADCQLNVRVLVLCQNHEL